MNIVLRLAFANLKKNKNFTAALILLSALSTIFLNIGLNMGAEMRQAFPACAERLNTPDFFAATSGTTYKTSFEAFLKQDKRVSYVEKEEIIYTESTENNVNNLKLGALFFNCDSERKIEPMLLLKKDSTIPTEKAIYLPRTWENNGASLGGEITFTIKNTDYSFLIAGFFECSYMGTSTYGFNKYFIPEERFQELSQSIGAGTSLSALLADGLPKNETSRELRKDFLNATDYYAEVGSLFSVATCLSYEAIEETVMSLFSVPTALMIAVAFIIGIITFIIVHFKVKEGIDKNMVNIGCLQAMGYTTGQILCSEIAEFAFIGAVGGFVGIILSYAAMPFAISYGEGITGIVLHFGIHINLNLLSFGITLLLMILSTLLAAWKIKKIPPVTALRKGVKTHHFGQNLFPLGRGSQSIHMRLALKNISSNLRQNITTITIIALCVYAVNIAVVLYSNFGNENSAVTKMTGVELADVQVLTQPHADILSLQNELEFMEEVRKTNLTDSYMMTIQEEEVQFIVSNDFSKTETLTLSKGSFPKYDNEVVLTSILMKKLDKQIGDDVSITTKGTTRTFEIVGIHLGTNSGGQMGLIHLSGLHKMDPYYKLSQIDVYLKDPQSAKVFMEQLYKTYDIVSSDKEQNADNPQQKYNAAEKKAEEEIRKLLEQYGANSVEYAVMLDGKMILSGSSSSYQIKEISSLLEYLDGQLQSYTLMMNGLMAIMLLVMLLVIGSILFITIRSLINRQKEEFGIYKALGYTTSDLVKIIRLNFVVNAAISSLLGGILCILSVNKVLRIFFISMGLDLANFAIPEYWLILVGILTVLYVFILTTIKAYQVRKISVYEFWTD